MNLFIKQQKVPRLFLYKSVSTPLILQKEPSDNTELYLDVKKSGQHRDPSVGQYIKGKRASAHTKEGEKDLTSFVQNLMDQLPGEELKKDSK